MRGLKLNKNVAIEHAIQSHPLRMRGLKPMAAVWASLALVSHPLRMRGLKLPVPTIVAVSVCRILYGCVD